jgi:hypothetical protein
VELFSLLRPEWHLFFLGTFFSFVTGFATPLLPTIVMQPLFNDVIGKQNHGLISSVLFKDALVLVLSVVEFHIPSLWWRTLG